MLSRQTIFDKDIIFEELMKERFLNQIKKWNQIKQETIDEINTNNLTSNTIDLKDKTANTKRQLF